MAALETLRKSVSGMKRKVFGSRTAQPLMQHFLKYTLLSILLVILPARSEELLVIANLEVPVSSLSTEELAKIYLLKMTTWQNGINIVPVNREVGHPTRLLFSEAVLGQHPSALAAYWNQMHFKGKSPPLIQKSDQAVLAFVQNVPGAIGYVSASIQPQQVKILARVP